MSRSTFPGSGKYVAHGLGDNHRTWEDMKLSIAGVMNFQMFGIPMTGPYTCGYFPPSMHSMTDEDEICGRWNQLSTFYPLSWMRE